MIAIEAPFDCAKRLSNATAQMFRYLSN
jgi:hypothetical protein